MLSWRGLAIHKTRSRKDIIINHLADPPRASARFQRCGFGSKNKWTPGGMVLAFAKVVIATKKNPAKAMWAQCQDVDRVAAMMCFLQLSLWNIPAVVIVGNTLAREVREVFYTPAHRMGFWDVKLARRERERAEKKLVCAAPVPTVERPDKLGSALLVKESVTPSVPSEHQHQPVAIGLQSGFDFGL